MEYRPATMDSFISASNFVQTLTSTYSLEFYTFRLILLASYFSPGLSVLDLSYLPVSTNGMHVLLATLLYTYSHQTFAVSLFLLLHLTPLYLVSLLFSVLSVDGLAHHDFLLELFGQFQAQ
jgi:hypothetical protein